MGEKKVRAKFTCNSVKDFGQWKEASFNAVYSDKGENKDFCEATPSGELSITISGNVPAKDFFKPQTNYYLDFTEADSNS